MKVCTSPSVSCVLAGNGFSRMESSGLLVPPEPAQRRLAGDLARPKPRLLQRPRFGPEPAQPPVTAGRRRGRAQAQALGQPWSWSGGSGGRWTTGGTRGFSGAAATVSRPDHGQMLLDSLVPLWDLTSKRARGEDLERRARAGRLRPHLDPRSRHRPAAQRPQVQRGSLCISPCLTCWVLGRGLQRKLSWSQPVGTLAKFLKQTLWDPHTSPPPKMALCNLNCI